jgi:hypothetical protein
MTAIIAALDAFGTNPNFDPFLLYFAAICLDMILLFGRGSE